MFSSCARATRPNRHIAHTGSHGYFCASEYFTGPRAVALQPARTTPGRARSSSTPPFLSLSGASSEPPSGPQRAYPARTWLPGIQAPCFTFHKQSAKDMAIAALTHSSMSAKRNNMELSKVGEAVSPASRGRNLRAGAEYVPCSRRIRHAQSGKAAAVKAVFRRNDLFSGADYDRYALSRFATKNLAPIARGIGLEELQRVGRGGPAAVSDEMCARAFLALLGVLELTVSPISRIMPFCGERLYPVWSPTDRKG